MMLMMLLPPHIQLSKRLFCLPRSQLPIHKLRKRAATNCSVGRDSSLQHSIRFKLLYPTNHTLLLQQGATPMGLYTI
jgi:hypothetical protein